MSKICSSCGYKTEEKDLKCPICGGALYRGGGAADPCDPAEEAEWNGGYHNDFEEGRKTGDYCDSELEKLANGGQHYHGTVKTTYSQKTDSFPLVGPIIAIGLTKSKQSEAAAAARKAAIALLIVTIIVAAVFGSGIL